MTHAIHTTGTELWEKAKTVIPGGNQLLSKRAEMFLPENWPAYFKRAKGVEVWDLDDNHLIDMSIMGIGTCVLGYANDAVNQAVNNAIALGTMCTLNSYEEVQLAEKLIDLHPWAGMVRFARTGGEACAIAVRIGRTASRRDKVAFCGYHGWSDWYLSSNYSDDHNLDQQLLPGLRPAGVPRALKNTALPFNYGKIDELKKIISENPGEIGVIMMEVQRHQPIDINFLKEVRALATQIGAVLIYDEITSGFRLRAGGLHMLHSLEPDIVTLGKALGNGFPISAIVGRKKIMDSAQETFISSTYWTERIGFVAALEVIRQFEKNNVAAALVEAGNYLIKGLRAIFDAQGLNIQIEGIPPSPILVIQEEKPLVVKTLFTQEMLKRGFLASTVIYISIAHTQEIMDRYLKAAAEVFSGIRKGIRSGNLEQLLEGPVCHSGFKRLA